MTKEEVTEARRWNETSIACYKRIISGVGCKNCKLFPFKQLESIYNCNMRTVVKDTIKNIGLPKPEYKFFGHLISESANKVLDKLRAGAGYYDLQEKEKIFLSDLYKIARKYGYKIRSKGHCRVDFVDWLKEREF